MADGYALYDPIWTDYTRGQPACDSDGPDAAARAALRERWAGPDATRYDPPIIIMWGDKLMKPGVGEILASRYYFATSLGDSKLHAYLRNDIPLAPGMP